MQTADRRTERQRGRCGERERGERGERKVVDSKMPTDRPTDRPGGGRAISPLRRNEWPAGGCSLDDGRGRRIPHPASTTSIMFPTFTPAYASIPNKADSSFIYKTGSPAWNQSTYGWKEEGRKEGQDPKTGLKMEEKKKLQALWTNTNNIAIHQTVSHCTCPLPAISKTHFLFPPRSIFSSLDRGGLSISAYEKIAFRFLSFPLFHLSLYPFLSPRPAMHSSQTSHSAVSSSVDASLHFPRTPLPTPSSLSL